MKGGKKFSNNVFRADINDRQQHTAKFPVTYWTHGSVLPKHDMTNIMFWFIADCNAEMNYCQKMHTAQCYQHTGESQFYKIWTNQVSAFHYRIKFSR
jgi:hypothetical protein